MEVVLTSLPRVDGSCGRVSLSAQAAATSRFLVAHRDIARDLPDGDHAMELHVAAAPRTLDRLAILMEWLGHTPLDSRMQAAIRQVPTAELLDLACVARFLEVREIVEACKLDTVRRLLEAHQKNALASEFGVEQDMAPQELAEAQRSTCWNSQ